MFASSVSKPWKISVEVRRGNTLITFEIYVGNSGSYAHRLLKLKWEDNDESIFLNEHDIIVTLRSIYEVRILNLSD